MNISTVLLASLILGAAIPAAASEPCGKKLVRSAALTAYMAEQSRAYRKEAGPAYSSSEIYNSFEEDGGHGGPQISEGASDQSSAFSE